MQSAKFHKLYNRVKEYGHKKPTSFVSISVTFYSFPRRCVSRLSTLFALLLPLRCPPPPPPPYTCMEGLYTGGRPRKEALRIQAPEETGLIFSPPPPFLVRCRRRLHCLRGEGEGQQKGRGEGGGVPGNNHFFEKGEPRKKGRGIVFSF